MSNTQVERVSTPVLPSGEEKEVFSHEPQPFSNRATTATFEQSSVQKSYGSFSTGDREHNHEGPKKPSFSARLTAAFRLRHRLLDSSLTIDDVDGYPVGYGKIPAFEESDPNFLIYRKFGWLHNSVLLHLQDELAGLEEDLKALDRHEFQDDETKLLSRRLDDALVGSTRIELLKRISCKPSECDEVLLRLQKFQAMEKPTKRDQNSLADLIHNTRNLAGAESDWIRQGEDLVALGHDNEPGWFIGFIADILLKISRRATTAIFRTHEQKVKSGDEFITLFYSRHLDVFLRIIFTVIASIHLLVPVLVLFRLQPRELSQVEHNSWYQILTILLFTLTFSASCSIFTKAKGQEVFAATAAYAAILVAFLGNSSSLTMNSNRQ